MQNIPSSWGRRIPGYRESVYYFLFISSRDECGAAAMHCLNRWGVKKTSVVKWFGIFVYPGWGSCRGSQEAGGKGGQS